MKFQIELGQIQNNLIVVPRYMLRKGRSGKRRWHRVRSVGRFKSAKA